MLLSNWQLSNNLIVSLGIFTHESYPTSPDSSVILQRHTVDARRSQVPLTPQEINTETMRCKDPAWCFHWARGLISKLLSQRMPSRTEHFGPSGLWRYIIQVSPWRGWLVTPKTMPHYLRLCATHLRYFFVNICFSIFNLSQASFKL